MLKDEPLGILQAAKIFDGISDDHLKMIFNSGNIKRFNTNDIIIQEGQTGHPLHIIVDGEAEIFLPQKGKGHTGERPTRIKLKKLIKGDCIGEYSLIDNKPASASAVALSLCETYQLSRQNFKKIIVSSDHLAKNIYKNMLLVLIQRCRDNDSELDMCNICY